MKNKYFRLVTRDTTNPAMSHDGGDYSFGVTVVVLGSHQIAGRHWTSCDAFEYCRSCGTFGSCSCEHEDTYSGPVYDGSDAWELIADPGGEFYPVEGITALTKQA